MLHWQMKTWSGRGSRKSSKVIRGDHFSEVTLEDDPSLNVYEVVYEVVAVACLSRSWLLTLKAMEERKVGSQGSGNWRFEANDSKDRLHSIIRPMMRCGPYPTSSGVFHRQLQVLFQIFKNVTMSCITEHVSKLDPGECRVTLPVKFACNPVARATLAKG